MFFKKWIKISKQVSPMFFRNCPTRFSNILLNVFLKMDKDFKTGFSNVF
jgi:hypothetical protein